MKKTILTLMALMTALSSMAVDPSGVRVDRGDGEPGILGPFIFLAVMIAAAWIKVKNEER